MGRAKRPRSELVTLLAEQREGLAASCEGYDKGKHWEAARLATTTYTLLHDSRAIISILTQLGLRSSLRFVSSGRVRDPNALAATPPLCGIHFEAGTTQFIPRFRAGSMSILNLQFPTWWEKEMVYMQHSNASWLSRKRIVFALRNQDGGGHIGVLTDNTYADLKRGGGWFGGGGGPHGGPSRPLTTALPATMRQIAWEVTETLNSLGEVT